MSATLYVGENAYFLEFETEVEPENGEAEAEGGSAGDPVSDWAELAGPGYGGGFTGMGVGVGLVPPMPQKRTVLVFGEKDLLGLLKTVLDGLSPSDESRPMGPALGRTLSLPLNKCSQTFVFYRIPSGGFVVKHVTPIQQADAERAAAGIKRDILREVAEGILETMDKSIPGPAKIYGFEGTEKVLEFVGARLGSPITNA